MLQLQKTPTSPQDLHTTTTHWSHQLTITIWAQKIMVLIPPPIYEHDDAGVMTLKVTKDTDYDEPYFEPASKVEELFDQLLNLDVPNIEREHLR